MSGGGGKGGGSTTVGYRYFMDIHQGLCRGPLDEIVQINVGDLHAWPIPDGDSESTSGAMTIAEGPSGVGIKQNEDGTVESVAGSEINTYRFGTSSGDSVTIAASELFGGDKKEGGVAGTLHVFMGEKTQVVPTWIKTMLGGLVSDWRNAATLYFSGLICSLNPYPKSWTFRVRRVTKGWMGDPWLPELATIWMNNEAIKAMNPAHIIYQCATDKAWGLGIAPSVIGSSFAAAAQTLYDENFGLCLAWNKDNGIDAFVQSVIDHIGGAMYVDKTTGKLELKLFRFDYNPDDLPTYTYDSGLLEILEGDTSSRDSLVNEMIVNWFDPILNEKRQSRVHNLAAIQTLGGTNSNTVEYKGAPTAELALRLAQRDLKGVSSALKNFNLKLDRRAWKMSPGDVFRISAPDKGITNMILRATKVEDGSLTDGTVKVQALNDVFGLEATSYGSTESGAWVPPDRTAKIATNRYVREATYRDLVRRLSTADLATITTSMGTVTTFAAKPSSLSLNYEVATAATGETFESRNTGPFAPFATLATTMTPGTTSISVSGGIELGMVEIGDLVQIGDEICRVDFIDLNASGVTATMTIARGCIDTVPTSHAIGTKMFFDDNQIGYDAREYETGEVVGVKLLTVTSTQVLGQSVAPTDTITIAGRQGRPLAPGKLRVNGTAFGSVTSVPAGDVVLLWAHRDRLTQMDVVYDQSVGDIGPEAGTTYTVQILNGSTGALVRTVTGLSSNTWTYTAAMRATDALSSIRIKLWSVRSTLASHGTYDFTVTAS